ncbi:granulocyte-macrophage colony-stimulating factor receptor subunit alpha-like [Pelobates fuscus]|uniref:granulocyte-macrophage colony-stimulating factor receptor subunit alpha-like n=1 Tax=Pelobates fuscus TaxID=191477 RepID=UPI002FE4B9F2
MTSTSFLQPTNVNVQIIGKEINLFWDCTGQDINVTSKNKFVIFTQESNNQYSITTTNDVKKATLKLNKNVEFKVRKMDDTVSRKSKTVLLLEEISVIPKGISRTATENVSLMVFSSLATCHWISYVGENLFYSLPLQRRQHAESQYHYCENNFQGRTDENCALYDLQRDFSNKTTIFAEGYDNQIQPIYLNWFEPSQNELLYLTNLTWKIIQRKLHVSWECNIPKEIQQNISFSVTMDNPFLPTKRSTKNKHETFLLYPDTKLMVTTYINGRETLIKSNEVSVIFEGMKGTAAENVSCVVLSTYITCSWNYGKNAPNDTVYTLFMRQHNMELMYNMSTFEYDAQKRKVNCRISDLKDYFAHVCITIEGSSKENIQMFVMCFTPAEKEMLNPPGHISLERSSQSITIRWARPYSLSEQEAVGNNCYEYNIQIDEKIKDVISTENYTVHTSLLKEDCWFKIRARGMHSCGLTKEWGEWSKQVPCGYSNINMDNVLIPSFVAAGVLVTIIILLSICIWQWDKCFPTIPKPKIYLDIQHTNEQNMANDGENHTLSDGPVTTIIEDIY